MYYVGTILLFYLYYYAQKNMQIKKKGGNFTGFGVHSPSQVKPCSVKVLAAESHVLHTQAKNEAH